MHSRRNRVFESINRIPVALDLIEKMEEASYELHMNFMLDEECEKAIKKVDKKLDKLYQLFDLKRKETLEEFKKLKS